VDFAYTLHTGQPPLFSHDGLPLEDKDVFVNPPRRDNKQYHLNDSSERSERLDEAPAPSDANIHHLCIPIALDVDFRVSSIFSDLRDLASEFNRQSRMRDSDFKLVISRIQYRLLSLSNTLDDILSECLRLAMLAFLASAFEIPDKSGRRYPHLSQKLHANCLAIFDDARISKMWPNLVVWLLMVGAMSLYGVDEEWLRDEWRAVVPAATTWNDTRARLKSLLWIDTLHDKLGKETFQALSCRDSKAVLRMTKSSAWWMSGWGVCPLEI
jgi:hypothetical protein